MMEVPPVLLSAIVCDRVIFDKISGMPSLINIIQTINVTNYPVRSGQIVFFCELTNGHGKTKTKVKIVNAQEDDKAVFEQEGMLQFNDVKQVVTLAVTMQGIIFTVPGEYRFQLFADDYLLGERRLICRKFELPPKTEPGMTENP